MHGSWILVGRSNDDKLTSYKCRYSWICQGGSAPATCHETHWPGLNASSCVDAEGESVTLKNYDHWCSNGWDAESPMCSADSASFDMSDSCWEIHSCGLLKKEASIVCHGASGEKLCCAKKQEHCCIYDEGSIKPLFITTLVVVIILGLFLILQCWRWSRPEPSPLRASPSAAPPPEPEPIAQAEVVPYPNR